ncbi:hypothetical protein [Nocardioides insulae]|uniref:hypothetical protein n=1 Tax=Nocardioides insulae TaxID=394734 RepID=UPI00042586A5|nr:hypothetical protein [Nocardioides insulae]
MAEKVFLHVGTPKAGTTYLQGVLWGNQHRMRAAGVLLPGTRPFQHNLAASAVRAGWRPERATVVWEALLEEISDFPGTALLSNEWFSLAGPGRAAEALRRFGDAEVHVVLTARDLTAVAPAAWQEVLKLGRSTSLHEFLAGMPRPRQRWSHWTLDPSWVLRRWSRGLPPERVHVVTVPTSRAQPHLLWERFATAVGIPADAVDPDSGGRANESIGVESARLLELLGPRLRDAVEAEPGTDADYRWLRRYLSHQLLVPRGGSRIGLSAEEHERLHQRSVKAAEMLRERGFDIVGDLAELTSGRHDPNRLRPFEVSDAALVDVAAELVVELLRELHTTSDQGRPVPDIGEFDAVLDLPPSP